MSETPALTWYDAARIIGRALGFARRSPPFKTEQDVLRLTFCEIPDLRTCKVGRLLDLACRNPAA